MIRARERAICLVDPSFVAVPGTERVVVVFGLHGADDRPARRYLVLHLGDRPRLARGRPERRGVDVTPLGRAKAPRAGGGHAGLVLEDQRARLAFEAVLPCKILSILWSYG